MPDTMYGSLFHLLLGLVLLYAGAEALVHGSAALARRLGLSPLVIGLTVVAFGTSAPELAVSAKAALDGMDGIAMGNVIGSNIANIALVIGAAALVRPIEVHAQVVRWDIPVVIVASLLALAFAWDGHIAQLEGGILVAGLIAQRAQRSGVGARDDPHRAGRRQADRHGRRRRCRRGPGWYRERGGRERLRGHHPGPGGLRHR